MANLSQPLKGGRVSHLFIFVENFETMFVFYNKILGFEVFYFENNHCAFLNLPGNKEIKIALFLGRESKIEQNNHWFIMIDVDNITSAVIKLKKLGVQVGKIENVPYGKAAKFEDPEGNIIEIHEKNKI